MTMLSAADLARMRSQANELLDTTCTIQTKTASTDSIGGETYSWANTTTGVACRLNRYDTQEQVRLYGDRPTTEADWVVTLAHDASVVVEQRIVVSGLTLEPVWLNTGKSIKAATRVVCREVA